MSNQSEGKVEIALKAHGAKIRALSQEGVTRTKIAKKLRLPYHIVIAICNRLGISNGRKPAISDDRVSDWTLTNVEIAADLGVPVQYVVAMRSRLRRRGKGIPPAPLIGPLRLNRKNYWGEVLPMLPKIRKLANPKVTLEELCAASKLPEEIVAQLLRRLQLPSRPSPAGERNRLK